MSQAKLSLAPTLISILLRNMITIVFNWKVSEEPWLELHDIEEEFWIAKTGSFIDNHYRKQIEITCQLSRFGIYGNASSLSWSTINSLDNLYFMIFSGVNKEECHKNLKSGKSKEIWIGVVKVFFKLKIYDFKPVGKIMVSINRNAMKSKTPFSCFFEIGVNYQDWALLGN